MITGILLFLIAAVVALLNMNWQTIDWNSFHAAFFGFDIGGLFCLIIVHWAR